jgi:hypothetical protein
LIPKLRNQNNWVIISFRPGESPEELHEGR